MSQMTVNGRGARGAVSKVLAIALLAGTAALLGPAPASAKVGKYQGAVAQAAPPPSAPTPENQIPNPNPNPPPPTVEFKGGFGKKRASGKPAKNWVSFFVFRNIWYLCSDGRVYYPGSSSDISSAIELETFPINFKKQRFSISEKQGEGIATMTITGRLPRRGPATGTLRYVANAGGTRGVCDTGVLSWTANKVG